jgi:hypothetical protein
MPPLMVQAHCCFIWHYLFGNHRPVLPIVIINYCCTSALQGGVRAASLLAPAVLLLSFCLGCQIISVAGGNCSTNAIYTSPTAAQAAQALTGNSPQLVISNPMLNSTTPVPAMLLITNFSCHYLATSMPQGEMLLAAGSPCSTSANTSKLAAVIAYVSACCLLDM